MPVFQQESSLAEAAKITHLLKKLSSPLCLIIWPATFGSAHFILIFILNKHLFLALASEILSNCAWIPSNARILRESIIFFFYFIFKMFIYFNWRKYNFLIWARQRRWWLWSCKDHLSSLEFSFFLTKREGKWLVVEPLWTEPLVSLTVQEVTVSTINL